MCWWSNVGSLFLLNLEKIISKRFSLVPQSARDMILFLAILVALSQKSSGATHGKENCVRMTIVPRDSPVATAGTVVAAGDHEMSTWIFAIALACGIWYFFILVVQAIGFTQLYVNTFCNCEASLC
jgi:hypothetical protein